MEETKKEEVTENKEEVKEVKNVKLSPAATVLLSIVAALGLIILVTLMYFVIMAL